MSGQLFLALLAAAGLWAPPADSRERLPLFDAHLHYNWEPRPRFSLEEVLDLFRRAGVTGVLANSRPNDG
ncbi:MAG: hypothetical protein JNM82_10955, partial [Rhodocyclaceae bacterium]|nr:hypothetical protein [Rhodocyclaceae bacterium]